MDLKKINAVGCTKGFLPTKPLSELTPRHKYPVTKIPKVQTKYGARIVVELNSTFNTFLPPRLLTVFEDRTLEEMQIAALRR